MSTQSVQAANRAALEQYLTEATYQGLCDFARVTFYGGHRPKVRHQGVWKYNVWADDRATETVNEALLRVLKSEVPYRGDPRTMGAFLMTAIRNVRNDSWRRISRERLAHAAMTVYEILREQARTPRPTLPAVTHGDGGESIRPISGEGATAAQIFPAPHVEPGPDALSRVIELEALNRAYLTRDAALRAVCVDDAERLNYLRVIEDGQPVAQIAKELGKAPSTVKRRFDKITRAVEAVQKCHARPAVIDRPCMSGGKTYQKGQRAHAGR